MRKFTLLLNFTKDSCSVSEQHSCVYASNCPVQFIQRTVRGKRKQLFNHILCYFKNAIYFIIRTSNILVIITIFQYE